MSEGEKIDRLVAARDAVDAGAAKKAFRRRPAVEPAMAMNGDGVRQSFGETLALYRAEVDELEASRVKLQAIRAEVEPWADRILRDRIRAILDGTGG